MNRLFFITILLLINFTGFNQITSDPALPTASDEVVITLDATQGNGDLAGYAGDIYAHTGIITNLSSGTSDWKYVIAGWSTNLEKAKLTRIATDIYTLDIGQSIREYYGVPESEIIEKLAFVFRNADGSKTGRATGGGDIFLDVAEEGLVVGLISPTSENVVFPANQDIEIGGVANFATSLTLFIDENEVYAKTEETPGTINMEYTYTPVKTGRHEVLLVAANSDDETKEATGYFFIRGDVPVAEIPEGLIPGINYIGDNEVTLVLHDPPALKEFVFAIGDFSNWEVDDQFYMKRTTEGTHYWVTITDLDPNKEYIYQYWIDGDIKLADPYTEKISDPWHDHWISDTNYPNLIEYPYGKTTGIASVFQINVPEYEWEVTDFTPPPAEELIIYELHIRDFVEDDYIVSVIEKLDYLETLGVNAIELMPINEFEGNDSWGYNPSFYFASDKAYGTKNDYKRFIDESHKRGIAVIVDIVLNHSFNLSPFVQMYFDEDAGEWGKPSPDNPWFLVDCPHQPWCWGNTFDQDSPYTQELFNRILEYWLVEYKVDGFRFDYTKGFTNVQSANEGNNYDVARISNLKRIADHVWDVNPQAYVLLEHFTANNEEKELAEYRSDEGKGMLLWGNVNHAYNEATMGWLSGSNFNWVSHVQRGWNVPHLIGYMESHDEERLMFKNLEYGNSSNPDHDVKNLNTALQRQKLAGVFFFTIPGPKMIWQFGELGYDYSINYCEDDGTINDDCRTGRKPVRWDYFEVPERRDLYNSWAELISLRREYPVFNTSNFNLSLSGAGKRITLLHNDMNVVIVGNFNINEQSVSVTFPVTGTWYEYYTQTELAIEFTSQSFNLQPSEYRIYTSEFINRQDYIVSAPEVRLINNNAQVSVWPNPFTDNLSISIFSPKSERVKVNLYDINGRKISNIHDGIIKHGENILQWSKHNNLPNGVYMIVVDGEAWRRVERIIVN